MNPNNNTIEPGLYQCNMGGASLGECWRLSKGYGFLIALFLKIVRKKMHYNWLPVHENLIYCDPNHLTNRSRENIEPYVEKASSLGFQEGQYLIMDKFYNGAYSDNGGYVALHQDNKRFIRFAYAYTRNSVKDVGTFVESSALACYVGFYDATNKHAIVIHNDGLHFDGCGHAKPIYLRTKDIKKIAERAEKEFRNYDNPIQSFRDISHLDDFVQPLENELWRHRINRGLFVKVPPEQERRILNLIESEGD